MKNRTSTAITIDGGNGGFERVHVYTRGDGSTSHFKGKRLDGTWAQWPTIGDKRINGRGPTPEVLYNRRAIDWALLLGQPIWVTEGEKDADVLIELGLTATTVDGGAGSWPTSATEILSGAKSLHVILDNDPAGLKRMPTIASVLHSLVPSLRFYLPAAGKDVFDHVVSHGLSVHDLVPKLNVRRFSAPQPVLQQSHETGPALNGPQECGSVLAKFLTVGLEQIASSTGERNNTLNRVAYFNMRVAIGNSLPLEPVEHALTTAALAMGLSKREIAATIKSATRVARKKPLPLYRRRSETDTVRAPQVEGVAAAAHAAAWPGKGGRYRKKILLALTQIAGRANRASNPFTASRTTIMKEADTPSTTSLENALKALIAEGWIEQVSRGSFTEAAQWRLLVPIKYQSFPGFRCTHYSAPLAVGHAAFRPSCWGFSAFDVIRLLDHGRALSVSEVANESQMSASTVRRSLQRLASDGAVVRAGGTWSLQPGVKSLAAAAASRTGSDVDQRRMRSRLDARQASFLSFRRWCSLPKRVRGDVIVGRTFLVLEEWQRPA